MSTDIPDIRIPAELLPADGRFGAGPSKVRRQAVDALAAAAPTLLGTSHRQKPVQALVGRVRSGIASLLGDPATGHRETPTPTARPMPPSGTGSSASEVAGRSSPGRKQQRWQMRWS